MNLTKGKLISIAGAIVISIAAPLVTCWMGWMLSLENFLIFAPGLVPQVFIPIAAMLFISVTPIFIFIFLKMKSKFYIFPIVGGVAPLPISFVMLLAFGALADDVEMAMRLITAFSVVITGFISGITALLLSYIWNATTKQQA